MGSLGHVGPLQPLAPAQVVACTRLAFIELGKLCHRPQAHVGFNRKCGGLLTVPPLLTLIFPPSPVTPPSLLEKAKALRTSIAMKSELTCKFGQIKDLIVPILCSCQLLGQDCDTSYTENVLKSFAQTAFCPAIPAVYTVGPVELRYDGEIQGGGCIDAVIRLVRVLSRATFNSGPGSQAAV